MKKLKSIRFGERLTFFSVRTNTYIKIKRWATSFDPLGSCCTRIFKNEMYQDDAGLVEWLLWLATHTFLQHRSYFSSLKVLNENVCVWFAFFLTVLLHHVSDCVILGQLGKHGCPDDFKFKLLIWETVWVLGSIQGRLWNQKTKVWGHFG